MTATQSLALPGNSAGPNLAPAKPLERYLDSNGKEQKPFSEWIKRETDKLETLNRAEWADLALVWQLLNMMINGDQLAVRGHRSNQWMKVPMPTTTMAPVRQQNKLGFYSRVLMSKWVSSRTKIKAVAGDDSDQTAGAVRSAQIFADVIQPIVYSELFRQQEGLAGQAHGTYARYFYYDEQADGGTIEQPITEQREIAGGGYGQCFECGYVGSAEEFEGAGSGDVAGTQPAMAGSAPGFGGEDAENSGLPFQRAAISDRAAINAQYGHDELAEWQAGLERPHPPEEEEDEDDEAQHLRAVMGGANSAASDDLYGADLRGDTGAEGAGGMGAGAAICPSCASPNVEVEPPQVQTIEAVVGTEKRQLGQMRALSVPYTQLRHELSCSLEESPWMRWKRKLRTEEIQAKFPGVKIPHAQLGTERDPGLATEDALRRSVAQSGRNGRGGVRGDDQYSTFTQWWLTPCMYSDYVFPTPVETLAGETIPAGAKATEVFPDGMYIALCEGIDTPLQVRNECHKWHWVSAPYRLQMFSGLGIGINDAMEMQRQWNVTLSLIFEQIRSTSLPGWLYDKDAISPDDVRLLGQPQNSVPVSTQNREGYTSLETFVKQMPPGQLPSHIPWYIGQLDANMQTAAGALVNEGVPGMDSKTATGAELMASASNQHNAPEFALKGDADVRSMKLLFDLACKHYVEPRYLPLTGRNGKQDGVWLSAADFANGQVRWEAVPDSWLPNTKLDKQNAIQAMFLAVGGPLIFMELLSTKPDIAHQLMETFGVDADDFDDEYADTAILCRQRLDQVKEAAQMAAPLLQQAASLGPMVTMDPATGMPMQVDPTEILAQEIVNNLQPPMVPEEPGHNMAVVWYRQALIDDEIKDADPLTRMCVQLLVRKEVEMMAIEAQVMQSLQMMANPQPPMPGEGEEGGGSQSPQKSPKQSRDDQRRAQMGGGAGQQQGQTNRPQPRPSGQAAMMGV